MGSQSEKKFPLFLPVRARARSAAHGLYSLDGPLDESNDGDSSELSGSEDDASDSSDFSDDDINLYLRVHKCLMGPVLRPATNKRKGWGLCQNRKRASAY